MHESANRIIKSSTNISGANSTFDEQIMKFRVRHKEHSDLECESKKVKYREQFFKIEYLNFLCHYD